MKSAHEKNVYLDWNATTPLYEGAMDAMREAMQGAWGNPASTHRHGSAARAWVEKARMAVATLAGVDVRDVLFTSGGTEANNMAIRSAVRLARLAPEGGRPRVLTSKLEHPSVTNVCAALEREGVAEVRWLAVLREGTVDLSDLERALAEGPSALVAVQAVNHETGVLQPVGEVLRLSRDRGVPVHVDTVQAFGRLSETWLEASSRVLASHKLRGPKGLGALITRPGARTVGLLQGGAQERGLRPGTVDPVACAGLWFAAAEAVATPARYAELASLRDQLEDAILTMVQNARVAGQGARRAPHVSNIVFPGLSGPELVAAFDVEGVSVSAGSACSAGTVEPSPVLLAMLGEGLAGSGVRFSLGPRTTRDEVLRAIEICARVLPRFR